MVRSPLLSFALFCSASLCVTLAATAAGNTNEIHKCATPTGIAYQSWPCSGVELPAPALPSGSVQAPPASTAVKTAASGEPAREAASEESARGAPSCGSRPSQPRRLPWRQATICIGMTDDEVLNLPGWGRPAKIIRTRAPREWREQWIYDAAYSGPRQLHFVNGALAVVERPSVEGPFVEMPGGAIARLGPTDAARAATN